MFDYSFLLRQILQPKATLRTPKSFTLGEPLLSIFVKYANFPITGSIDGYEINSLFCTISLFIFSKIVSIFDSDKLLCQFQFDEFLAIQIPIHHYHHTQFSTVSDVPMSFLHRDVCGAAFHKDTRSLNKSTLISIVVQCFWFYSLAPTALESLIADRRLTSIYHFYEKYQEGG